MLYCVATVIQVKQQIINFLGTSVYLSRKGSTIERVYLPPVSTGNAFNRRLASASS